MCRTALCNWSEQTKPGNSGSPEGYESPQGRVNVVKIIRKDFFRADYYSASFLFVKEHILKGKRESLLSSIPCVFGMAEAAVMVAPAPEVSVGLCWFCKE